MKTGLAERGFVEVTVNCWGRGSRYMTESLPINGANVVYMARFNAMARGFILVDAF